MDGVPCRSLLPISFFRFFSFNHTTNDQPPFLAFIYLSPLDSRLIEIATAALNPPRVPTPEPEEEHEPAVTAVTTDEVPSTGSITGPSESEAPVNITAGVPGSIAVSNSFRFMQDSELEGPFDETPADVPQEIVDTQEEHPLVEGEPDSEHAAPVNGHVEESPAPVVADVRSALSD